MIVWLTDTLLATSLLMALVMVLREPVRRLFGPGVAYALWLLPAARLLMPTLTRRVERAAPSALPDAAPALVGPLPAAAPPIESIDLQGVVLSVWLGVAAILLIRGVLLYRRQRRLVLADAVQVAKLDKIRIVRTHALRGPMAFGVIDRVIALPADFDDRYDERQRRLALDHELAHHRSGDLIANHVAFVLLCLQWFNPIAWLSHAAFRFDQEAACDARVLDKAGEPDRAAYGQAIAKAASGRALLFSGALDRPSTLQRRLNTMLVSPNRRRRIVGRTLVAVGLAAALPLTASWATHYVDVPAPPAPPAAPLSPAPPLPPIPPEARLAPIAPTAPIAPLPPIHKGKLMIHGQEKDWSDLSPQEKAQMRAAFDEARRGIANAHIDRSQIRAELNAAKAEMAANRGEMRRELQGARREVAEAMHEIDRNAAELRRHGQDPEALKATVRASLRAVEGIDVEAISRQALASVDPALIERSLEAAEEGIRRAQAALDAAEPNN